jgi:hypothetical protein
MEDELDRLLRTPILRPPPDFAGQVMMRIQHLPAPEAVPRWQSAWRWLALAAAAVPAMLQLLAFMFGMWAATAAG